MYLSLLTTATVLLQNGFDPHDDKVKTKFDAKQKSSKSLVNKTRDLFTRVPILGVLCGEVVFCQCLSAVVTFMFVRQVKSSIGDDQQRAGWTGNVSYNVLWPGRRCL